MTPLPDPERLVHLAQRAGLASVLEAFPEDVAAAAADAERYRNAMRPPTDSTIEPFPALRIEGPD